MTTSSSTCEIVESTEELDCKSKMDEKSVKNCMATSGTKFSIEEDINRLFEAIDIKSSGRALGPAHEGGRDTLRKSAMKRPIRIGSSHASGIGISEPMSLKQALRGLCISQASEMAALKRSSQAAGSSRASEAGSIKRMYRAVVVESGESGQHQDEVRGNLVEISLVPERITSSSSEKMPETAKDESQLSKENDIPSIALNNGTTTKSVISKLPSLNQTVPMPTESSCGILGAELGRLNSDSLALTHTDEGLNKAEVIVPTLSEVSVEKPPMSSGEQRQKLHPASVSGDGVSKSTCNSPRVNKPFFRSKSFIKKKVQPDSVRFSKNLSPHDRNVNNDLGPSSADSDSRKHNCALKNEMEECVGASPASSSTNSVEVSSKIAGTSSKKSGLSSNCPDTTKSMVTKVDERSRDKGEFSQSSKSSIGEYSSSTSISEDSILSGSSRSGNRPHMSKDLRWEAIRDIQKHNGSLGLRHFKLLKKLGCGDIGTVYLGELINTKCLFALKVMDNEFLVSRKKMPRAQTEREIMQMLDHPFLPTLYAHFTTEKLSCLVMEYCPGGDLHVLRQKQPARSFSEQAARFYVGEVLLALEYLHMLGVVYRDLKPENILVREDGHIMLTDFDLSLRCTVDPMLIKSSSPNVEPPKKVSSPCSESSCIDPFCLHPSWQVSCFTPRLLSVAAKSRKIKADLAAQVSPLPQLVVEPTSARSNSFVGTHEYLAPEIIKGEGHGNAVDWWTFGIFLFELLYGRTPFKGSGNEETLSNVVSQSLKFPSSPIVGFNARDLIRGLLVKEPENRLGSVKGAAEIKQHPFFEGLNWALIRCAVPPEMPRYCDVGIGTLMSASMKKESIKGKDFDSSEDHTEFEMF